MRAYLQFYGGINEVTVNRLTSGILGILQQAPYTELYFIFTSNGGDVNLGIAFYYFLKSLPVKVYTHNTGTIDSIGNVIFLAGKERFASKSTTFLFHGAGIGINQGASLNLSQMGELKSKLAEDQKKIGQIISSECKLTSKELEQLFIEGESKDTSFAMNKGIINDIRAVEIINIGDLFFIPSIN